MADSESIMTITARAPVMECDGLSVRAAFGVFFVQVERSDPRADNLDALGKWDGRGWWVQPCDLRRAVSRAAALLTET